MKPYSLAKLLHAFFYEWMGQQRNLSRHTVLSYRDTWKLLLRFVSERKRREITALSLSDLEAAEVLAFLQHLENDRKVSIGTRNCRLAAIHSFFAFVARREPLAIAQCSEIARIPVKKMNRPAMGYLDAEEITAILRQPDRSNPDEPLFRDGSRYPAPDLFFNVSTRPRLDSGPGTSGHRSGRCRAVGHGRGVGRADLLGLAGLVAATMGTVGRMHRRHAHRSLQLLGE
jgi:hypothetical protein